MTTVAVAVACWIVLTLWGWLELGASGLVPLSTGLTVGIVYAVARASGARGWPLFRLLLQLYAGVNVLNVQIENLAFDAVAPGEIARTTATGLLAAVGVSAALAWASTRDRWARSSNAPGTLPGHLWWKLPALGLLYIVLFLTAGAFIFPYIREFYDNNPAIAIPSFGVLLLSSCARALPVPVDDECLHGVFLSSFFDKLDGVVQNRRVRARRG